MSKPLSVYLCGFMGCGKSHIGRQLAAALGRRFIDLDRYIVNAEGMTIPEIFDKYGEPHFRKLEAKYIRELSGGRIVATGGGALINDERERLIGVHQHGVRGLLQADKGRH